LTAGLEALERELPSAGWIGGGDLGLADISLVCAFGFTQILLAAIVDKTRYPRLAAFSARAEELPAFRAAPMLDGVTAPFAFAH
jgi:glutathione S-transferase